MNINRIRSYAMLISSMLIFGTIGIFRRMIPVSSSMLACFRGLMGGLLLLLFIRLRRKRIRHGIGLRKCGLLCLTGGIMGANWIALFEAYNYTTVGTATLCYYMQPTIVILLSPLLFHERLGRKKLLCALVSLIGMCFVSGITESGGIRLGELRGVFLGLLAAALYAAVVILNKKVQIEDAYEKTIIQLFSAAIVLLPYLLITGEALSAENLSATSIVMLLIVGLVHTGVAYVLYFGSMEGLQAQSIAVLSYIDPISALVLSAIFLGEHLTACGLIGAVMIIGAALVSELDHSPAALSD